MATQQEQQTELSKPDGFAAGELASDSAPRSPRPALETAGRFYRPELDVVRFLAFFLVFLTHSLPSGRDSRTAALPESLQQVLYGCQRVSVYGLSLFFTLSAYLICELLLRERAVNGTVLAKQFYIRRILRIWPLYFAGLAIGLIGALVHGGRPITLIWIAWAATLLGNWFIVFREFPDTAMFALWSVSVEEQFYLFAPWAVKVLNRKALTAFSIVLIIIANFQLFSLGSTNAPDHVIWYNSFVEFENFAAGMLLCLLLRGRSPRKSVWQRLFLLAAWALCWCVASYGFQIHTGGEGDPGSWSLIGGYALIALGCCFLLVAILGLDKRLLPGWTIYLGRISYGLYVFHMLALYFVDRIPFQSPLPGIEAMLLRIFAGMGLTILLASLSYRYFETPFLRMKKRHEVIESRPV